jgi:ABC-type multidrug transport system ATPase subunit
MIDSSSYGARMAAAPVIRLTGISKRYGRGGRWVLDGLDAELPVGSVTALTGRNGAGKSTLLRVAAGAIVPTRGRRDLAGGARIGYAPEGFAPAPPFTAIDYLRHHGRLRRIARADGDVQVAGLARRFGFESLLGERLGALSKGSLQKVVLVQALLGEPAALVLDEPFSGLDTQAGETLCELVAEHAGRGACVLFSDHRDRGARPAVDRSWLLEDGRLAPAPADAHAVTTVLEVAAGESDRRLAALLADGWHVEHVAATGHGTVEIRAVREARE